MLKAELKAAEAHAAAVSVSSESDSSTHTSPSTRQVCYRHRLQVSEDMLHISGYLFQRHFEGRIFVPFPETCTQHASVPILVDRSDGIRSASLLESFHRKCHRISL
jgi:hypothetical protein